MVTQTCGCASARCVPANKQAIPIMRKTKRYNIGPAPKVSSRCIAPDTADHTLIAVSYTHLDVYKRQASGVGPYSGQSVHFRNAAPDKNEYAINRYAFEAQRHFGILDARLAKRKYMLGDTYTIVDMDVWGWARLMPMVLGEGAWAKFPNLKRLVDEISARPAAERAVALRERYQFKTEMDDLARRSLYRHQTEKVA